MLISTKGRYALRVMLELASHYPGRYMPLSEIADNQHISEKYLESIVSMLSRAGEIEGLRGKGGGYRLSKNPDEYSVGEIIRLTEGSIAPVSCLDCKPNPCEYASTCKTLPLWEKLDTVICNFLDSVKLSDLLSQPDDYQI